MITNYKWQLITNRFLIDYSLCHWSSISFVLLQKKEKEMNFLILLFAGREAGSPYKEKLYSRLRDRPRPSNDVFSFLLL